MIGPELSWCQVLENLHKLRDQGSRYDSLSLLQCLSRFHPRAARIPHLLSLPSLYPCNIRAKVRITSIAYSAFYTRMKV